MIINFFSMNFQREILKATYLSPFDFSGMLIIIHVSLMSGPISGIKMARLMWNTQCMNFPDSKIFQKFFISPQQIYPNVKTFFKIYTEIFKWYQLLH